MQIDQDNSEHADKSLLWTTQLESQLFALHDQHGNKWSIISAKMNSLSENCVKNKFYSTLRKGFRKINKYLKNIRRRISSPNLSCNKLIKPDFLVKLNAVVDRNYIQKYEVKQQALALSLQIQKQLINLAKIDIQYELSSDKPVQYKFQDQLLIKIQEFNRNCKKRKGKRKQGKANNLSIEQQIQEQDQVQNNKSFVVDKNEQQAKHVNQEAEQPKQMLDNTNVNDNVDRQLLEKMTNEIELKLNGTTNIQYIDDVSRPTQMAQSNVFENLLNNNAAILLKKDTSSQKQISNSNYLIDPVPIGAGCFQFYHQKVKYHINNDLQVSVSSYNQAEKSIQPIQNSKRAKLSLNKLLGNDSISIFSSNNIRRSIEQSSEMPIKTLKLSQSEPSPFPQNNANSYNGKFVDLMPWVQKLQRTENDQLLNKQKQQK